MFPAGAGMNRIDHKGIFFPHNVPRRRGDEPATGIGQATLTLCSPQARG